MSQHGAPSQSVAVKGTFSGWQLLPLTALGGGVHELVWSESFTPHGGLLNGGDTCEFVFVLDGVEYKDLQSWAHEAGVSAFTRLVPDGTWDAETIVRVTPPNSNNDNTAIVVGP